MSPIDIDEAAARLEQLLEAIESGAEIEIVITENGMPMARLVPMKSDPGPGS